MVSDSSDSQPGAAFRVLSLLPPPSPGREPRPLIGRPATDDSQSEAAELDRADFSLTRVLAGAARAEKVSGGHHALPRRTAGQCRVQSFINEINVFSKHNR